MLRALGSDYFFLVLVGVCIVLTLVEPGRLAAYPGLVDWSTVAALAGLLVLTKGVEASGFLHQLARRLILRMRTERALALCLVSAAALLSTLLTNDVALFVIVPITLGLRTLSAAPVTRLIIFEALAVNAGSTLTPFGNPQNLFLWQLSGVSFERYVGAMLPLTLLLLVPLTALTCVAFRGRALRVRDNASPVAEHKPLLYLSLALYLPFLVLADLHRAGVAVLVVGVIFVLRHRDVLARVDWALIAVFILMFIDLRLIAEQPLVHALMARAGLADPRHLYLAGIAASQLISNVPAAILLAEYSKDWRTIAYAVNVGGFGLVLGSLANIIALRMANDGRAWIRFHAFSLPCLAVAGALVYLWLFLH